MRHYRQTLVNSETGKVTHQNVTTGMEPDSLALYMVNQGWRVLRAVEYDRALIDHDLAVQAFCRILNQRDPNIHWQPVPRTKAQRRKAEPKVIAEHDFA
jgi:hypothetical protein